MTAAQEALVFQLRDLALSLPDDAPADTAFWLGRMANRVRVGADVGLLRSAVPVEVLAWLSAVHAELLSQVFGEEGA